MVMGQCDRCGKAVFFQVKHVCDEQEAELMTAMKAEAEKRDRAVWASKLDAAVLLLSTQTIPANDRGFVEGYGAAIKRLEAEARNIRAQMKGAP